MSDHNCAEIKALLSLWLYAELDSEQSGMLDSHLTRCAHCRAEFAALKHASERLSRWHLPAVDSQRWDAFGAELHATLVSQPQVNEAARRIRRPNSPLLKLAATACLCTMMIGAVRHRHGQKDTAGRMSAGSNTVKPPRVAVSERLNLAPGNFVAMKTQHRATRALRTGDGTHPCIRLARRPRSFRRRVDHIAMTSSRTTTRQESQDEALFNKDRSQTYVLVSLAQTISAESSLISPDYQLTITDAAGQTVVSPPVPAGHEIIGSELAKVPFPATVDQEF